MLPMILNVAVSFGKAPQADAAHWLTFNRTLEGDRYSPLSEINTQNVSRLRKVAAFDTGTKASFQTGPVVVDGTLYFTTYKHTYAIDGATGKMKWKHVADVKPTGLGSHRGAAYLDGRIYRGYSNGWVIALDAANGAKVWGAKIADPTKGESIPMAPIAWDGKVFIGNVGGDNYAVTGRVYALDASTGRQVWRFDTVPSSGQAADTWKNKDIPQAGACTWTSYSLEPESQTLYVCAGNPAPDFAIALRPGQNLYSNCLIAIDADTGKMRSYVQPTKNDAHDWDLSAAAALITTRGGKQLAAVGGKDGILYGIDRSGVPGASGSVMPIRYRTPVTRRFNVSVPLSTKKFTRFAPGSQGGVEWNGPGYSPTLNLIFTPAIDWPTSVKLAPISNVVKGKPGQAWTGAHDNGFGRQDPPSKWGGYVTATDADTGSVRWKYRAPTPVVAAVTPTAGNIVFTADLNGYLRALDARTGKQLWKHDTGRPIGGGIVSYAVDGKQYIAVAAGLTAPIWPTKSTSAQIVIYRLP